MRKITVGLLFNTDKKAAVELAGRVLQWGGKRGIDILVPDFEAPFIGVIGTDTNTWREHVSCAVVIGGDGTFLRASRILFGSEIPLFGVNVGRLGFLASVDPKDMSDSLDRIVSGDYLLQPRMLIKADLIRATGERYSSLALNEVAVTKSALARIIYIDLYVDEKFITGYPADGLIVSTPTGSTAYSLSAGGPIVPPFLDAMIVAPICPHLLATRPLLLSPDNRITLTAASDSEGIMFTIDGQSGYQIGPDDSIEIVSAEQRLNTIYFPEMDYFDLIRQKLQWGLCPVQFIRDHKKKEKD